MGISIICVFKIAEQIFWARLSDEVCNEEAVVVRNKGLLSVNDGLFSWCSLFVKPFRLKASNV